MAFHEEAPRPSKKRRTWWEYGAEAVTWLIWLYVLLRISDTWDSSLGVQENFESNAEGHAQGFALLLAGLWQHFRETEEAVLNGDDEKKDPLARFREVERLFDVLDIDIVVPAALLADCPPRRADSYRDALLDRLLSEPEQWQSFQSRRARLPYDEADQRADEHAETSKNVRPLGPGDALTKLSLLAVAQTLPTIERNSLESLINALTTLKKIRLRKFSAAVHPASPTAASTGSGPQ